MPLRIFAQFLAWYPFQRYTVAPTLPLQPDLMCVPRIAEQVGWRKKNSYSVQNPFNRSKVYISRKYGFYSLSPLFFVLLRKNAWKLGDCRVLLSTLLWHFMAWSMTRCELSSWKDRYYRANMSWGIEKKNDRKTSSRNIAPLKWRLFLFPAKCQKKKKNVPEERSCSAPFIN